MYFRKTNEKTFSFPLCFDRVLWLRWCICYHYFVHTCWRFNRLINHLITYFSVCYLLRLYYSCIVLFFLSVKVILHSTYRSIVSRFLRSRQDNKSLAVYFNRFLLTNYCVVRITKICVLAHFFCPSQYFFVFNREIQIGLGQKSILNALTNRIFFYKNQLDEQFSSQYSFHFGDINKMFKRILAIYTLDEYEESDEQKH